MEIQGKPLVGNGTLVMGGNEAGAITFSGSTMNVRFANDAGAQRADLDLGGLVFYNLDDSTLGTYVSLDISTPGKHNVKGRFALWTMGTPVVGRVLHYSFTDI